MRIAHINMLHNGSTGKIMLGISDVAEEMGHICKTFSPLLFNSDKNSLIKKKNHITWGNRLDSFIHTYAGILFGLNGRLSYISTMELIGELKTFNPDIIHLHNIHNFTFNLPLLFRYIKKNKVKVVWTLHDCWSFTGHCPYFDMVKCEKWKQGCYSCPQPKVYPKTYIDNTKYTYNLKKRLFNGVENMTLVTPSKWLADLVKQSFMKNYPVRVINNGIDLSVFKPSNSDIKKRYGIEGKYLLLGVAFGWSKRKGLDVFVELSKRLSDEYAFVLVGTDDRIDQQLPDNIISVHRTESQQELAEIYSAADLLVNPTREENYPTVNMESLACGTPVVTFDTGGSAEIIDETCGCAVCCDDIDEFEKTIKDICENHRYASHNCLRRAESFDFEQKFVEYVELYNSL